MGSEMCIRDRSRIKSLAGRLLFIERQIRSIPVLYHFCLLARQADHPGLAAGQRQLELLALLHRTPYHAHFSSIPARSDHFPIDERGRLQGGHSRVVPRLGAFSTNARRSHFLVHSYRIPLLFNQPAIALALFTFIQIKRKQYDPILHSHHLRHDLHQSL